MARRKGSLRLPACFVLCLAAVAWLAPGASASAINVFGFCQGDHGAQFQGGWDGASGSQRCHRGMFGVPAADGALFDSSSVRCDIPGVDEATGDSSRCTCFGVPQCDGGVKCDFDCSCNINGTAAANAVNSYFSGRTHATWSGTFFFEAGTADVECVMAIPTGQYVHGYTLNLHGNQHSFECTDAVGKAASNWTCNIKPMLSATALVDGNSFAQVINVVNSAGRPVVGVVAAAWVLLAAFALRGW